jgi:hypothetical protein
MDRARVLRFVAAMVAAGSLAPALGACGSEKEPQRVGAEREIANPPE